MVVTDRPAILGGEGEPDRCRSSGEADCAKVNAFAVESVVLICVAEKDRGGSGVSGCYSSRCPRPPRRPEAYKSNPPTKQGGMVGARTKPTNTRGER